MLTSKFAPNLSKDFIILKFQGIFFVVKLILISRFVVLIIDSQLAFYFDLIYLNNVT